MNADGSPASIDLAREADFRLGALLVQPSRREIGEGQARELLEPRVMQALVALARRAGEVVSRDQLIECCWDGRIVGEDAINNCIAKVRRVGAAHCAFAIETIPRVGYRLQPRTAPDHPSLPPPSAPEVLLAVLPFDNLSDDPQLGFFSDGISEEILHTLVQRVGLKVIGRASSFQFRGADKALRRVADMLRATHVLDGSVRRAGERLRISAQLVETDTQTTLWVERFERPLSDSFLIEDEIASAVAESLQRTLTPAARRAVDPVVHETYLRARSMVLDLVVGRATLELCAIWSDLILRFPTAPLPYFNLLFSLASEGDWEQLDRWLTPDRLAYFPRESSRAKAVLFAVEAMRTGAEASRRNLEERIAATFAEGVRVPLTSAAFAARDCDLDWLYGIIDELSFDWLRDPAGRLDPADGSIELLFMPDFWRLRSDGRFVGLCAKLGYAAYWAETDRWPDCAAETAPYYDFKSECRRVAETRRHASV